MPKFFIVTLTFVNILSFVYAQETIVPDQAFEQALIDLGYDDVIDGYVLTANIEELETLDLSNRNIENLTGIEDFSNLKELLCQNNYLLFLDLSKNINLEVLNFSYSSGYEIAPLPFDISQNKNLLNLNCTGNRITNLNVGHLKDLETLICSSNKLSSLDISQNLKLKKFDCSYNELTKLNVDYNPNLVYLDCGGNLLPSLRIDNNPNLVSLRFGGNFIPDIDLSKNINLQHLYFGSNPISEIDLSALKYLKEIYSVYNYNLKTLDLRNNANIEEVSCFQNQNVIGIYLEGCSELRYLNCRSNKLVDLDLSTNENLQILWCQNNNLEKLDLSHNGKLQFLKCENNKLEMLNIRNGNNTKMTGGMIEYDGRPQYIEGMNATDNSQLKCIEVDNENDANLEIEPYNTWLKDDIAIYSQDCSASLGVDDESLSKGLIVFPNPIKDILKIKSENIKIDYIQIYNIQGQLLIETNSQTIDTRILISGLYFIKVNGEKGLAIRKILKI